ncbi:hypothetical protein AVEN_227365-1 [Araneus ventricosus]|uniref:Uncharacterized protein n=1 Tax=Araneus ventricosus TaxID=182803 RepID=A0A4Y2GTL0_ARAVE|nr:hypothetical protein AVEN_227365-1 [Araneus ventricosus]
MSILKISEAISREPVELGTCNLHRHVECPVLSNDATRFNLQHFSKIGEPIWNPIEARMSVNMSIDIMGRDNSFDTLYDPSTMKIN